MKKIKNVILPAFALMIAFCGILFAGCGNEETKITIKGFLQNTYVVGESLNVDGLELVVTKGKDKTTVDLTEEMIKGFDSSSEGERVLAITYGDKTIELSYKVEGFLKAGIYTSTAQNTDSSGYIYRFVDKHTVLVAGEPEHVSDTVNYIVCSYTFNETSKSLGIIYEGSTVRTFTVTAYNQFVGVSDPDTVYNLGN